MILLTGPSSDVIDRTRGQPPPPQKKKIQRVKSDHHGALNFHIFRSKIFEGEKMDNAINWEDFSYFSGAISFLKSKTTKTESHLGDESPFQGPSGPPLPARSPVTTALDLNLEMLLAGYIG